MSTTCIDFTNKLIAVLSGLKNPGQLPLFACRPTVDPYDDTTEFIITGTSIENA